MQFKNFIVFQSAFKAAYLVNYIIQHSLKGPFQYKAAQALSEAMLNSCYALSIIKYP